MRRVYSVPLDTGQTMDAGLGEPARGPRAGAMASDADFTGFFRAEFGRVVRTVFLILNDHGRAEEIAQDAFLQLLNHWEKVSEYDEPGAWVRRVAIRMAGRTAHRERMRGLLEIRFRPTPQPPPDAPGDEVVRAVRRAIIVSLQDVACGAGQAPSS